MELADGASTPVRDDIAIDGVDYRKSPGDGEFDICGFVDAAKATGFDGPWGVEVLSIENRGLALSTTAQRNYCGALAQLGS